MKFSEKRFITAVLTLTKSIIFIYAEIPFMLSIQICRNYFCQEFVSFKEKSHC